MLYRSHGRRSISKVVIIERRGISFIHVIERKHDFSPHFKFKNHNHAQNHVNAVYQNVDSNTDKQNHEGSKSEVQSQQIGFTPEQYLVNSLTTVQI